jgi:hypothetical protein
MAKSIKDRVPKTDDDDVAGDDELDAMFDELEADSKGPISATKLARMAAKKVDKDDPALRDSDDEDDAADDDASDDDDAAPENETPAERLARKKKAAEKDDKDEESESDDDADDEDDESDDAEEGDDEESEEEEAEEKPKPGKLGPSQKALSEQGFANADKISEDTAKLILAQRGIQKPQEQVDPLSEIGRAVIESMRTGKPLALPTAAAEAKPDEAEQKRAAAEQASKEAGEALLRVTQLAEKLKGMPAEPEYDPRWESQVVWNGTAFVPPPNQPHLQSIADKANAHRDWELKAARLNREVMPSLASDVSAAIKGLQSGTGEVKGLTEDQVNEIIRRQQSDASMQQFLQVEVLQKNKNWMFAKDTDGNFVINPDTKMPFLSTEGLRYDGYCTMLKDRGMTDLRAIHNLAITLTSREEKPKKGASSGVDKTDTTSKTKGNAGRKSQANDELDEEFDAEEEAERKAALKRKAKKNAASVKTRRAGKAGIANDEDADDEDAGSKVKPLKKGVKQSLSEMLRSEMSKSGITDRNLRFGD